ncbi:MAG TPA: signal recognition particle protein [Alphaproteobacteria bacterium]|jgi:signal recognition particle subunit SRP54|nr:signal recognition particle protein [Alphaproteobacteria bacterium]MDP6270365.1 signal recognition particle protein [Alphaproteobacteria bacterium]MDP7164800.1 signal recognition particle protein [Alphaproteobacteria bacterium]MDP7429297.1 signal recognition particle protein [Alphaproteobacteria bacterium]HJM49237.1 signal recognition particle protein [Alphaproteobacteria bacterium]
MFESLSNRLSDVFEGLRRRGALSESDVEAALREVRVALLEADVALPVVKDFVAQVKTKAVGADVVKSVTPGQMVVKIVHDHLVEMLGAESVALNLAAVPPVPILMVGLQGSGKTTTTAKLGLSLQGRDKKKVMMASLDVQRPAAQEQLRLLGEQAEVTTLPIVAGQMPVDIASRAMAAARLQGFDVVLLDTAGRLHVDEALMSELAAVRDAVNAAEILLVADALTGQDAVNVAEAFRARIEVSGIVLTRVDGDARGGAALSMRAVTGCPIKLLGVGENLDALEVFHPDRIASRILGMGDVVGLVEKAAETIEQEDLDKLEAKMLKGQFDLEDMAQQLGQMRRMGGMEGMMAMLPGVAKMKKQIAEAQIDERQLIRQEAIISSMTPRERRHAKLINASRKRRIAGGSGTTVQDVNRVLKQHKQMTVMMKKVKKLGKKGLMRHGLPGLMPR